MRQATAWSLRDNQKQGDPKRGTADSVDRVRFVGGENVGDEGAMIQGKEPDGEEDNDGQEKKTDRTQQLSNGFRYGFTLVTQQERS
ncbi:Uncharacterized protein TCM_025701 [Theobroma cacao]|uniref:Uncharacterized protein n=1 Tax=Theobroma cacao TaxID=3641 RepID=A0A061F0W8_THECC|nr:Uncharacterized protein TCM_025701 [Theobroma cacao]